MFRRSTLLLALLAGFAASAPAPAQAQRFPRDTWAPPSGAREGRTVPFNRIERELKGQFGGQLVDANLRGDVYIVAWIAGDGRRLRIEVDAHSGQVLSVRG